MSTAIVGLALGVAVCGFVVAALLTTTRGADQATVTVEGDEVVVRPIGVMGLWSLSGGVRVPVASVVSAQAVDRASLPLGLRAPGAYLPGVICAGTYRRRGSKGLWMVARATQVLDIELQGQRYDRVVLQVADPVAAARDLAR